MKIEETSRRVTLDNKGNVTNVESISATIRNDADEAIGSVQVYPGNAQISINVHGFSDLNEGLRLAAEALGAELVAAEKGGEA